MKRLFLIIISIVIFTALGYLLWSKLRVDATGKVHTDLYTDATNTWDPHIQVLPFRPQELGGETIGSSTAIRLEWTPPEETYNHFLLTVTDPIAHTTYIESGEHDRVSLDVTGLKADTQYVFALQACFDPSCQAWLVATQETTARTPMEIWSLEEEQLLLNP
jgi:hypothetical protein